VLRKLVQELRGKGSLVELHKEKNHEVCWSLNFLWLIKSSVTRWAGRVEGTGKGRDRRVSGVKTW